MKTIKITKTEIGGLLLLGFACIFCSCSTFSNLASFASGSVNNDIVRSVSASGKAIASAAETITPEQEYYIGRAVAGSILTKYSLRDSAAVQDYLNKICRAMAANSDGADVYKGYFVAVLNTDEVNAFATPSGHILVSRGLLACAKSEDALAAVIAHEMSHIQLKHSVKAIKASRATSAIVKTAGSAASIAVNKSELTELVNGFGDSVNEIVSTLVDSGYSKSQEFEADENALKLMAAAGYDVNAMNDMLLLLKEKQAGQKAGFSKTHPTPDDRIKKLKKKYSNYSLYSDRSLRNARFTAAMKSL